MDKKQPTRTVKSKFLIADKIGRGIKAVGKPVLAVGTAFGLLLLKEAVTSKDETNSSDDD